MTNKVEKYSVKPSPFWTIIVSIVSLIVVSISFFRMFFLYPNIPWYELFFEVKVFKLNIETIRIVLWAVFSLLFASFATALSITLNKPKVSISAYFSFQNHKGYCFNTLCSVVFLIWSLFVKYENSTVTLTIVFILGICQITLFFLFSVIDMDIISNKEKIQRQFINHTLLEIKKKKSSFLTDENYSSPIKMINDQYTNFCLKCIESLEGENVNVIFFDFFYSCLENDWITTEDQLILLSYFFYNVGRDKSLIEDKKKISDESFALFHKCLIFSSLSNEKKLQFDKVLHLYLTFYKLWSINGELKNHGLHILVIKDALFNFYNDFDNDEKDENSKNHKDKKDAYSLVLNTCCEIIRHSFRYENNLEIEEFLHSYCQFAQFLDLEPNNTDIIAIFEKNLVTVCIWIVALSKARHINSSKFLYFIPTIISNHISKIDFSNNDDFILYPEVLPPTGAHVIKYTRNFYICLIILYLYSIWGNELWNKKLFTSNADDDLSIYQSIISSLDDISLEDVSFMNITNQDSLCELINNVKNFFTEKKEELQSRELKNLENQMEQKIEEEISQLKNDFENLHIQQEKNSGNVKYKCEGNIIISNNKPVNRINLAKWLLPYLYEAYDFYFNKQNSKAIKQCTYREFIQGIKNNTEFLFPYRFRKLLYNTEMEGIEYSSDGIKYHNKENNTIEIKLTYYTGSLIYDGEKVRDKIKLLNITEHKDKAQDKVDTCSISIPITLEFSFFFDKTDEAFQFLDVTA